MYGPQAAQPVGAIARDCVGLIPGVGPLKGNQWSDGS